MDSFQLSTRQSLSSTWFGFGCDSVGGEISLSVCPFPRSGTTDVPGVIFVPCRAIYTQVNGLRWVVGAGVSSALGACRVQTRRVICENQWSRIPSLETAVLQLDNGICILEAGGDSIRLGVGDHGSWEGRRWVIYPAREGGCRMYSLPIWLCIP